MQKSKGFTLTEIMIVVGIIVLISGIGLVTFFAFRSNLELRAATRDIISKLGYVQQRAVAEQIIYGIHFDFENDKYILIRFSDPEVILEENSLPERVSYQDVLLTDNQVKFTSTGEVFESGEVTLININDKAITIDIRPSGYVKTK